MDETQSPKRELIKRPQEEIIEKDPILDNLVAIGAIASQYGHPPKNLSSENIRILKTSKKPTQGYDAVVDLATFQREKYACPKIKLSKIGEPKSITGKEICNVDTSVSTDPQGNIQLLVDMERIPEAADFEDPIGSDGLHLRKLVVGDILDIKSPVTSLGPKTREFLTSFTKDALEAFQQVSE